MGRLLTRWPPRFLRTSETRASSAARSSSIRALVAHNPMIKAVMDCMFNPLECLMDGVQAGACRARRTGWSQLSRRFPLIPQGGVGRGVHLHGRDRHPQHFCKSKILGGILVSRRDAWKRARRAHDLAGGERLFEAPNRGEVVSVSPRSGRQI
jgi:hypothetical protein